MTSKEKLEIVSKNYADKYVESINVKNMVHKAYCEGFKAGYEKATIQRKSQTDNSYPLYWIPTSVQMPDLDQTVLVWHSYGNYEIGCLSKDLPSNELIWKFEAFDLCGDEMDEVEAWMPLPKPYTRNNNE